MIIFIPLHIIQFLFHFRNVICKHGLVYVCLRKWMLLILDCVFIIFPCDTFFNVYLLKFTAIEFSTLIGSERKEHSGGKQATGRKDYGQRMEKKNKNFIDQYNRFRSSSAKIRDNTLGEKD